MAVGGDTRNSRTDAILQYDPDDESWIVREERLGRTKGNVAALMVADDEVNCS